jgi:hypothetical protein
MNSFGGRVGWKEDAVVIVCRLPWEEVCDSASEEDGPDEEEEKELDLTLLDL